MGGTHSFCLLYFFSKMTWIAEGKENLTHHNGGCNYHTGSNKQNKDIANGNTDIDDNHNNDGDNDEDKMGKPSPSNKNKSKKRPAPQPGDPDYLTPTQLRNSRKRRKIKYDKTNAASKKNNHQQQQGQQNQNQKHKQTNKSGGNHSEDPSLRYLSNPTSAPTVKRAIAFFGENPPRSTSSSKNKNKKNMNKSNNETDDDDTTDTRKQQPTNFPVFVGPTSGWRTVARLAVRRQHGCLRIGLFVPGSHELMEIPQCEVHHPRINSAVKALQKKCHKFQILPFDEKTGEGNLRHVAIHVERETGKQQVTLIWKSQGDGDDPERGADPEEQKLEKLCQSLVHISSSGDERLKLSSLWVHYNNSWKHSNSIFDRTGRWKKVYGDEYIVERLGLRDENLVVPLHFPPQVFRQANIDAFTGIIDSIRTWLKNNPAERCLELYGGVGTIGLHLIDLIESLTSSDENPFNKACFEASASQLKVKKPGKKTCKSISYEPKNASDMVSDGEALNDADLVIVDPPRKGLDDDVLQALCQNTSIKSLIYVSCGFDAFCRDFQNLTGDGNWKLDHAEGHVLFPGSDAIETLACFTRRS